MGEYAKTYERIEEIKKERAELRHKVIALQDEINELLIQIGELDIEQGECEGYIMELERIDNEAGADELY